MTIERHTKIDQLAPTRDHTLRNIALGTTATGLGLCGIGLLEAATAGPDDWFAGFGWIMVGMLVFLCAIVLWTAVTVGALHRWYQRRSLS